MAASPEGLNLSYLPKASSSTLVANAFLVLVRRQSVVVGSSMLLMLAACSPLRTFDALVPKDAGGDRVVHDAAYAPGPRGKLDIFAPLQPADRHRPIIIFFYGGSWSSGTKDGYAFVGRALASHGFVVAIPDYRLVPQVRFPSFLEDNAAAVRWVRRNAARFGGDPNRIILAGHSAGAYDAAMLALDPRWLGPDRRSVRGLIGLAGPYDFLPLDQPSTIAAFGAAPDPKATQPVAFVGPGDPPAFLATGDEDRIVRPANSDALAGRLRAAGASVERVSYKRVGHVALLTAIARPLRGRAPVLRDLVAFATRVAGER